jgi:hypothetical protein
MYVVIIASPIRTLKSGGRHPGSTNCSFYSSTIMIVSGLLGHDHGWIHMQHEIQKNADE